MPDVLLAKGPDGKLHGLGSANDEKWTKFKRHTQALEPGECVMFSWKQPRNPKFHRKYMALLTLAYDSWEPPRKRKTFKGQPIAKSFDNFRREIAILSGFYKTTFDLKGRMCLEAKSISFANMEQEEFEALYEATVKVILDKVLTTYTRDDLDRVVAEVQRFGE